MQEGRQQHYTIPCPCRIIELQWRSKNRFRDHSDRIAKESHFCSLFKCVHIKYGKTVIVCHITVMHNIHLTALCMEL